MKLAAKIVRAITTKCVGHNGHGSCYLSLNSHHTLLRHPWDLFLYLKKNSSHGNSNDEGQWMKPRVVKRQWLWPPWMVLGGSKGRGKDPPKKKKGKKWSHGCCGRVPWLLVQGQQLPWLLWPVHFHSDHPNYVMFSPLHPGGFITSFNWGK